MVETPKKIEEKDNAPKGKEAEKEAGKFSEVQKNEVGKKMDQLTGFAEKADQTTIDNIQDFVKTNDKTVSEYTINGIADGQKFEEWPKANDLRKECRGLIIDLGQRMVLPKEYQTEYLNTMSTRKPNEVLALTRALTLLQQLPQDTLNTITSKLNWNIDDNATIGGNYRAGGLEARKDGNSFDLTEKKPIKTPENTEKQPQDLNFEFANELKRLDFIIPIEWKNQVGRPETFYFQKQVTTDGKSQNRKRIAAITYGFAQKRINSINLGSDAYQFKPSLFGKVVNNVFDAGRSDDNIVKTLNSENGLLKNISWKDTAKIYLQNMDATLPPNWETIDTNTYTGAGTEMIAFAQKVEKAQGKWGFRQFKQNFVVQLG